MITEFGLFVWWNVFSVLCKMHMTCMRVIFKVLWFLPHHESNVICGIQFQSETMKSIVVYLTANSSVLTQTSFLNRHWLIQQETFNSFYLIAIQSRKPVLLVDKNTNSSSSMLPLGTPKIIWIFMMLWHVSLHVLLLLLIFIPLNIIATILKVLLQI